ncbi:MAG: HAMP domain-containing histidine kinase [Acidobacteria bacterium]|nr:HAMP domain-containing histidine kinase [Acidobacteriota bacterium]
MTAELSLFPRAMSLAVHELRTPVTVVAGYLRMVLREQAGPLTDKQRKMLEEADRSCARINALVAEMSELGKLEARELTLAAVPFDLTALAAEVAGNMHEGEDRGIRLETRGMDQPIRVTGDRTRLAAALQALIHAAVRERGEPGRIIVECATISGSDPPWAVFAIGEEPAVRALLGRAGAAPPPFDEWRGGLGLALPVARRVIEAHGGALWSAPGDRPQAATALRLPCCGYP